MKFAEKKLCPARQQLTYDVVGALVPLLTDFISFVTFSSDDEFKEIRKLVLTTYVDFVEVEHLKMYRREGAKVSIYAARYERAFTIADTEMELFQGFHASALENCGALWSSVKVTLKHLKFTPSSSLLSSGGMWRIKVASMMQLCSSVHTWFSHHLLRKWSWGEEEIQVEEQHKSTSDTRQMPSFSLVQVSTFSQTEEKVWLWLWLEAERPIHNIVTSLSLSYSLAATMRSKEIVSSTKTTKEIRNIYTTNNIESSKEEATVRLRRVSNENEKKFLTVPQSLTRAFLIIVGSPISSPSETTGLLTLALFLSVVSGTRSVSSLFHVASISTLRSARCL